LARVAADMRRRAPRVEVRKNLPELTKGGFQGTICRRIEMALVKL
jgi:hypothetical protein